MTSIPLPVRCPALEDLRGVIRRGKQALECRASKHVRHCPTAEDRPAEPKPSSGSAKTDGRDLSDDIVGLAPSVGMAHHSVKYVMTGSSAYCLAVSEMLSIMHTWSILL